MLRKPIFMPENLNPNENLNLSKEQTIKQSLIKNEEESLKKEDFNKFSKSTLDKIKNDEKNYEAQTKQTNSEENNNKFIFKYKDFHNINNNLIILPSTIYPPFFMFRSFNLENHKENNEKKELQ